MLAKLAGERSYARGLAYFQNGAVVDLVRTRDALKARVQGSEEYRVSLRAAGRSLDGSCSCPLGEEGEFCKHALAAGLAWLDGGRSSGDELEALRTHLDSQSKENLIELVLERRTQTEVVRRAVLSRGLIEA